MTPFITAVSTTFLSPLKNLIAADLGQFRVIFLYIEKGILCVLIRIASMRRYENTQHTTSCCRKSKRYTFYVS